MAKKTEIGFQEVIQTIKGEPLLWIPPILLMILLPIFAIFAGIALRG